MSVSGSREKNFDVIRWSDRHPTMMSICPHRYLLVLSDCWIALPNGIHRVKASKRWSRDQFHSSSQLLLSDFSHKFSWWCISTHREWPDFISQVSKQMGQSHSLNLIINKTGLCGVNLLFSSLQTPISSDARYRWAEKCHCTNRQKILKNRKYIIKENRVINRKYDCNTNRTNPQIECKKYFVDQS